MMKYSYTGYASACLTQGGRFECASGSQQPYSKPSRSSSTDTWTSPSWSSVKTQKNCEKTSSSMRRGHSKPPVLWCLFSSGLRLVIGRHRERHDSAAFKSSCDFLHNMSALIAGLSLVNRSVRVKTALELSVSEDEGLNTFISRRTPLSRLSRASVFTAVRMLI